MLGTYEQSKAEFKLGNNREEYSEAKQAGRDKKINRNFVIVAFAVVAGFTVLVFFDKVIAFVRFLCKKIFGRKNR